VEGIMARRCAAHDLRLCQRGRRRAGHRPQ
jgi:hypothetical protein